MDETESLKRFHDIKNNESKETNTNYILTLIKQQYEPEGKVSWFGLALRSPPGEDSVVCFRRLERESGIYSGDLS